MIPFLAGDHQRSKRNSEFEFETVPRLNDAHLLGVIDRPTGQHQQVNVGFGVVIAAGFGALQNDAFDGETLAQDRRGPLDRFVVVVL
jgi:hypothetical protein